METYKKIPNKADISRAVTFDIREKAAQKRAQKELKNLENFKPTAEKAIHEAVKRGLRKTIIKRSKLIREITGDGIDEYRTLWHCCICYAGRKFYNNTEKELLQKEKEILQELRNDGYKVKIDGAYIIIEW